MIHLKKITALLLLISGYGIARAQTTASFNFSLASHPVTGWVNVAGDPATGPQTGTDATTGITVSSVAAINWAAYTNGSSAFDGGGATGGTFFPAAVMANHWFQYSPYYGAYNATLPQVIISGLNVDSVYTLKMTGSFASGVPSPFNLDPIRYSVAGPFVYGYIDVNGNNNTTDGAVFHNIAPDGSGNIKVYVNTISTTSIASICGIQITRERTTAPVPAVSLTHPFNNDVIPEDGNITISATASETNGTIVKVEFYADTTKIGEAATAPYSMVWNSPDAGQYTLKARAIDGLGNTNTSSISISIESLSSFWSTTGNIAANADSNFLGTVDTNRLAIRTNNVERVSILGDGTVGIGTKNTLGYKLAVNGTAIFTKVRVKTAGTWPDYVFQKDYVLPGLEELERYITEHKHLPGILPEAEVQRDGIDIGDHQAALLKRIEEMTLYLIEENKKLKEQNRQLEQQNSRLNEQQQQIDALKKLIGEKK